jgi:hypothetical protein
MIDPAAGIGGVVLLVEAPMENSQRLDVLLLAHHVLLTWHRWDAYLFLVGPALELQTVQALQRTCDEFNLTRSWIAPDANGHLLDSMRRRADHRVLWDPDLADAGPTVLGGALADLIEGT